MFERGFWDFENLGGSPRVYGFFRVSGRFNEFQGVGGSFSEDFRELQGVLK